MKLGNGKKVPEVCKELEITKCQPSDCRTTSERRCSMNECDFVFLEIGYFARYATTIGLIILGMFVEFYVWPNSSDDCSTPAAQYRNQSR